MDFALEVSFLYAVTVFPAACATAAASAAAAGTGSI